MKQADKDAVQQKVDAAIASITVDPPETGPTVSDLQAQLATATQTIAAQRQALSDKQAQNDALTISVGRLQANLDEMNAALKELDKARAVVFA